jgi:hypothetical protein
MGHALDFDDTFDRAGNIHPGIATLAASVAAAELDEKVSGRDVVLAVTLGLDVACRLAWLPPWTGGGIALPLWAFLARRQRREKYSGWTWRR